MRACLAMLCLTCVLCCTSAVEAQLKALRYVDGTIKLLSVPDAASDSSLEASDNASMSNIAQTNPMDSSGDVVSSSSYKIPNTGLSNGLSLTATSIPTSAIPACISLSSLLRPKVQSLPDLRVPNPCSSVDTVLALRNNLQQSLTISSIEFDASYNASNSVDEPSSTDAPASTEHLSSLPRVRFSTTSRTNDSPLSLPIVLVPGQTLRIPIHTNARAAGTFTKRLTIAMHTEDRELDTSSIVSLTVENDFPFAFGLAVDSTTFAPITVCDTRATTLHLSNPLCEPMSIVKAEWIDAKSSFSFGNEVQLPLMLQPGAFLDRGVRFAPQMAGSHSAQLHLSYLYGDKLRDTTIQFFARAVTNFHAHLTDTLLHFDTVLHCDAKQMTTYFHNESCDAVLLSQVTSAPVAGYSVVEPTKPVWVAKGDSVPVTILLSPTKSGVVEDYVEVHTVTREGDEHEFDLSMTGFVRATRRDVVLPASISLDSLTPCAEIDTFLTFINRGICDTLTIRRVNITGSSWFMVDYYANAPKFLMPGDTFRIPLRIVLRPEGSANADFRVAGDGFDTTIHLAVKVRAGGRSLEFLAHDTAITTGMCDTGSVTYMLTNPGCVDARLDSLYLIGSMPEQTQYRMETTLTHAMILKPGDAIPVKVIFDPDGNGDGSVTIAVRSSDVGLSRDIRLTGNVKGQKLGARIGLMAGRGVEEETTKAGQMVTVSLVSLDQIPDTLGLDGLSITVRYDEALLTERSLTAMNGWNVQPLSDSNGRMRLKLTRSPGKTVAEGSEIAEIAYYTTLSDSNFAKVTVEQPRFNPEDPNFERCKMSAISADDTVRIDISMFTEDAAAHGMNGDQPTIRSMAVFPNPVMTRPGTIAMAEVDFTLAEEGNVRMDLRDDLGKLVAVLLQGNLYAGKHYVPIALPLSANGNYFLSIDAGGFRDVRKIIIRN